MRYVKVRRSRVVVVVGIVALVGQWSFGVQPAGAEEKPLQEGWGGVRARAVVVDPPGPEPTWFSFVPADGSSGGSGVAAADFDPAPGVVQDLELELEAGTYRVRMTERMMQWRPAGDPAADWERTFTVTEGEWTDLGELVMEVEPSPLQPIEPFRLFDTRPPKPHAAVAVSKVPVAPDSPLQVDVAGAGGLPASGIDAVLLNVTAVGAAHGGWASVRPCGAAGGVSSLNFGRGQVVANAVLVPLSADGTVCFHTSDRVHLLADVAGWVRADAGFLAADPLRLVDTRPGRVAAVDVQRTKVAPDSPLVFDLVGSGELPAGARAVALNVTATDGVTGGHLSVYQCTSAADTSTSSTLNFALGQTVANSTMVHTWFGKICISSNTVVDVVVDLTAAFDWTSSAQLHPPIRVADTRPGRPSWFDTARRKVGGATVLEVPSDPAVVVANLTVTGAAQNGYVTVYPCGAVRRETSNVNFLAGQTVANLVVGPAADGPMCIFSSTPVDVVVDRIGNFGDLPPWMA